MDNNNQLQRIKQLVEESYSQSDTSLIEKLQTLLNSLKLLGVYDDARVAQLQKSVEEDVFNALNHEMFSKFTEADLENLTSAINTGLNQQQQQSLVLELYKKKSGKDILEFAANMYEEVMNRLIDDASLYLTLMNNLKTLSDDECATALELIKNGSNEEALEYVKSKSQVSNSSASNSETLKQALRLLEENKIEEAKMLLSKVS